MIKARSIHEINEVYELNLPDGSSSDVEYARLRSAYDILTRCERFIAGSNFIFLILVGLMLIIGGMFQPLILILLPMLITPFYQCVRRNLLIEKQRRAIRGILKRFHE